ncbi:MAG: DUF4164 family protein [Synergistaceae bacterium]|nr:DUF4164 family protein [Synergistaceae bacterium]
MAEERLIEMQYVPRDLFDIQLQHINERYSSEEKMTELRFDRFQASMERKFESFENRVDKRISGLEKRIDGVEARLNNKIDSVETKLNSRIDKVEADLKETRAELKGDINALNQKIDAVAKNVINLEASVNARFDEIDKNQNKWFAIFGIALTFITVAIPLITIIAQKFLP